MFSASYLYALPRLLSLEKALRKNYIFFLIILLVASNMMLHSLKPVEANTISPFGPPIRISTNTYPSFYPSVAASGTYVYVAWQDNTPVSGGTDEIWLRAGYFGPA